ALLAERGPQQWPYPQGASSGVKRLYEDGRFPTPSGHARFVPTPFVPPAEQTDDQYAFSLNTGRLRDQWHGMSRTGTIAGAFAHEPEPRLMMHAEDLAQLGVKAGELVKVESRRGQAFVQEAADPDVRRGTVFLAMHWGGRFLGGHGVNALTIGALDPVSRQPELKHCAVRIEAAALPWRLVACSPSADAARFMRQLEPAMSAVPYALRTLDRAGVRLSLAAPKPPAEDVLKRIYLAFKDGSVDVGDAARAALRGRTLCSCFDVSESEIDAFAAASKSLAELQARLRCGTSCGSCLPELRRKLAA
ncbi:MAG: molybdopterin dinucleotide binding domain-containing protein, partial [Gemmatimonadales bacterium]